MRKVSRNHNWTECKPNDNCIPDGQNCVWLSDAEDVVSWTDDYNGPCSDGSFIDGTNCLIKDRSQKIVWTRLPPGKVPKNYRFDHGTGVCDLINRPFELKWEQSAVIVMDMWDRHPNPGTGARAAELAPQINEFLTFARSKGAQIVHSPSCDWPAGILDQGLSQPCEFVGRYDQHPARLRAINARHSIFPNPGNRDATRQFYYYLSNGDAITNTSAYNSVLDNLNACPSSNIDPRFVGNPQGQTDVIEILATGPAGGDIISADGLGRSGDNSAYEELLAITIDRPYLIYCGINTNMCILKRTNGMRTMYQAGKALWLVRDLTDAMVGPTTTGLTDWCRQIDHRVSGTSRSPMHFDHYTGTQMVVDWIGDTLNACTDTSDKAGAGLQRLWFRDDPNRPGAPKYYILNKKYPGLTIPALGDGLGHWDHVDADASAYGATVCQWTLKKIAEAGAGFAYFEVLNVARPDTGIVGPDNIHADGSSSINTQQPNGRANARWLIPVDANGNPRAQTFFRMYNQSFPTYAMVAPPDGGGPWVYFREPNTGGDHELWQLTPV